jgi:orotate phosphoribosyltransferase
LLDATLAADINAIARLTGQFKLRSGTMADTYFDKYRFESEPVLLARLASAMVAKIPPGTQVLAGLELGGVPLATAMALQCGLPAVFVRKVAKDYGTCQAIEGRDVRGARVAIVEDVISTGGAVVQAARMLEAAGATMTGVVCAIWRPATPPGIEGMTAPVLPVFTAADLG